MCQKALSIAQARFRTGDDTKKSMLLVVCGRLGEPLAVVFPPVCEQGDVMSKRFFMPVLAAVMTAGLTGLLFLPFPATSGEPVQGVAVSGKPGTVSAPWVSMPAGARLAYIGIHGGTVPVSLLTSGDGSPMIARVGLTGSDFLHFMRKGAKPGSVTASADVLGGELGSRDAAPLLPGKNATLLMAGTAVGDVPVIYATGRSFEDMSLPANWEPFGLTEKALAAEGAVKVVLPPKKKSIARRPRS